MSTTLFVDAVTLSSASWFNDVDSDIYPLTAVAGTNTITATGPNSLTAYATGKIAKFIPAATNNGATTLNISSLGAKNVYYNGAACTGGELKINVPCQVYYDGTQFNLLNNSSVTSPVQILPISASVGSSALTISASALSLDFRSATLTSGTVTTVSGTPANLVISSGSTLGTVNAVQSRIVVIALNNAGTIELAAVNLSGGVSLNETGVISTTAEGGAGGADSATVIYSTTARSNVAYRVIGFITSTQATAGTWATAPSTIQGAGGQALTAITPGIAKAFVKCGVTGNIFASFGVTSVTDTGPGAATVNWSTNFSSTDYAVNITLQCDGATAGTFVLPLVANGGFAVGSLAAQSRKNDTTLVDPDNWSITAFGDQA